MRKTILGSALCYLILLLALAALLLTSGSFWALAGLCLLLLLPLASWAVNFYVRRHLQADMGVLASTDPIALDQACIDLVYASKDPGRDHLVERIESRHGILTIEAAARLGGTLRAAAAGTETADHTLRMSKSGPSSPAIQWRRHRPMYLSLAPSNT